MGAGKMMGRKIWGIKLGHLVIVVMVLAGVSVAFRHMLITEPRRFEERVRVERERFESMGFKVVDGEVTVKYRIRYHLDDVEDFAKMVEEVQPDKIYFTGLFWIFFDGNYTHMWKTAAGDPPRVEGPP